MHCDSPSGQLQFAAMERSGKKIHVTNNITGIYLK